MQPIITKRRFCVEKKMKYQPLTDEDEPRLHTHFIDDLPEGHHYAYGTVYCKSCDAMLHASNNECMRTWVETHCGNYCIHCFTSKFGSIYHETTTD